MSEETKPPTVPATTLAKLFNLTAMRVQQRATGNAALRKMVGK
jgi:hypothetical protein